MSLNLQEDLVYDFLIASTGLKFLELAVDLCGFWAFEWVFLLNCHVILLQFRLSLSSSLTTLGLPSSFLKILQDVSNLLHFLFHHFQLFHLSPLSHYNI